MTTITISYFFYVFYKLYSSFKIFGSKPPIFGIKKTTYHILPLRELGHLQERKECHLNLFAHFPKNARKRLFMNKSFNFLVSYNIPACGVSKK